MFEPCQICGSEDPHVSQHTCRFCMEVATKEIEDVMGWHEKPITNRTTIGTVVNLLEAKDASMSVERSPVDGLWNIHVNTPTNKFGGKFHNLLTGLLLALSELSGKRSP